MMENKKEVFKTIFIIVLIFVILATVVVFKLPDYIVKQSAIDYQEGYQHGVNNTLIELATQQTQSGNVLLVYNNSLQAFPIATLCGLGNGVEQ